jgi:hypothetical protein
MDADQQPHLRHSVAILWRGDAAAQRDATPQNSRFVRVFEALAASGIEARPAVYDESFADARRARPAVARDRSARSVGQRAS